MKEERLYSWGMLVLGFLVVGLVVGLVSAEFGAGQSNTFYMPVVSHEFTDLEWTEVGVPNVVDYTFEIDPNKSETIYLNDWRSYDSGQSWEQMGIGLPITSAIRHIATAPVSPTVVYAAVWGAFPYQIYRSLNGGDNWQGMSWVHHYRLISLAVNPITPTIIFVGAGIFDSTTYGGEVYRSTDGGYSWVQILPSFTMALDIVVDPQYGNVIYLGSSSSGLLKSADGGDSWQPMNNGLPMGYVSVNNILVHPADSQIVYITADGRLYRSSNGGENWVRIGSGLPDVWLSTLALNQVSPEMMFTTPVEGDDYYGIYQSLDEGYSWQRLAPNPVNEREREMRVQVVGNAVNLFVMFDRYGNDYGRFWKLDLAR